jgi:MOSC domain-containing protein YiiM
VLDPENVNLNDTVELIERPHNSIRLLEVWDLLYGQNLDEDLLNFALDYPLLAEGCKESLRQVKKVKFG